MALTDSSDLYGAIHEDGINQAIRRLMEQRPVYFNFCTQWVADDWPARLCCPPDIDPLVEARVNPVVSIQDPLPILGTGGVYRLDWAAQIAELSLDFHDSDRPLPAQLGSQLQPQQVGVFVRMCAGIGCPSDEMLQEFPPPDHPPITWPNDDDPDPSDEPQPDPVTIPVDHLTCFELELVATAHASLDGPSTARRVELILDGIEIVDVEPDSLEDAMECYLRTVIRWAVLPRLRLLVTAVVLDLPMSLGTVTIKPATAVAHNPAVEDDQLKVYLDLEVSP